jgi:lysozyme family protein
MNSNTAEIKNHLCKLISETEDESILSKVQTYFNILQSKNIDWWELISIQEKEAIYESQQQLKNGKGIPHQEVKQKVDKLLGRI